MPTEKPIVWIGRKARFTVTQRTTEHGGKTYPRGTLLWWNGSCAPATHAERAAFRALLDERRRNTRAGSTR